MELAIAAAAATAVVPAATAYHYPAVTPKSPSEEVPATAAAAAQEVPYRTFLVNKFFNKMKETFFLFFKL